MSRLKNRHNSNLAGPPVIRRRLEAAALLGVCAASLSLLLVELIARVADRTAPLAALENEHGVGAAWVAFVLVLAVGAIGGLVSILRVGGPPAAALLAGTAAVVFNEAGGGVGAYWFVLLAAAVLGTLLERWRRIVLNPGRRHLVRFGAAALVSATLAAIVLFAT